MVLTCFAPMLLGCVIGTVGVADEATAKKPDLVEDALPARIELTFGGPTPAEAVQVLLRDFKVQSSGGFTTEHGALTLQPLPEQAFVLLRPIHAGPVAHWRADYEFPALDEGKSATSRLGMVLGSRQQLVLALRRERTQGQNTGNLDVLLIAADAAFNLASIMKAKKDVAATIKAYEMVLDIRRQALGEKHPLVAQVQLELARAWAEQQDVEKSRALANAALAVLEACRGAEDVSTQEALRLAK